MGAKMETLARTEPLAVVDQAAGVAGDLVRGACEPAQVQMTHRQLVHVAFEERDLLAGLLLVAVQSSHLIALANASTPHFLMAPLSWLHPNVSDFHPHPQCLGSSQEQGR